VPGGDRSRSPGTSLSTYFNYNHTVDDDRNNVRLMFIGHYIVLYMLIIRIFCNAKELCESNRINVFQSKLLNGVTPFTCTQTMYAISCE
jgi:hypothetical protein